MKVPPRRILGVSLTLLSMFVLVRTAWICDDAYITFRSVENFTAGYGMGYNPFVRVQSFTHPLWMLLISVGYFIQTRVLGISARDGLYYLTMILSAVLSGLTAWLALAGKGSKTVASVVLTGFCLISSKAYVDFSTSGLEAPLTHLLLMGFWGFYQGAEFNLPLLFISGLLGLNRLDLLLLVLPALAYCFWVDRPHWRRNMVLAAVGFLPLIAWELFSLIYYGFLFPNTAYAKLDTGIDSRLLMIQGVHYLVNSLKWDPITLPMVALAGIILWLGRDRKLLSIYAGILLYMTYVVRIGGDFMSGRLFTAPFLLSVVLISGSKVLTSKHLLVMLCVAVVLGSFFARSPLIDLSALLTRTSPSRIDPYGIADERLIYFDERGLMVQDVQNSDDEIGSVFAGRKWVFTKVRRVLVRGATGRPGYINGPDSYVIDKYGLTDPLLARLPVSDKLHWRVGHFQREMPDGYVETLESGQMELTDPDLAAYDQKLALIVTGPMWSRERLVEIWKFNTGQYNGWLDSYKSKKGL